MADAGAWSASARRLAAVDQVGDLGQRDLAEPGQVAGREEVLQRPLGPIGRVDLAGLHPLEQVLGRDVDVDDLVGLGQHAVGEPLLDLHAGGPLDLVVEALQVLDVDRRDHVDPGPEQVLDVLVALGVAAAGGVGVRQLVDQADGRAPGEDRVEVHLAEGDAAVLDLPRAG